MSRLAFKYGTVHAFKSDDVIKLKHNFLKHQLPVMAMAPILTHQEDTSSYDYLIGKEENIFLTIKRQFSDLWLLIIDDAHLLSERQIDQLLQVAINLDVAVLCFGLRTDFRTSGFFGARRLLEIAPVLLKISTFCECGREALFSVRKENGKITFSGSQILRGNAVSYEALCPRCYYRKLIQYKKLKESGRM